MENTPEMIAWLAITVAAIANKIRGYIPLVNVLLAIGTLAAVLVFGSS